ncbi:hypothetical protein GCM10028796_28800 [Ramlibacter monticola]|uniref:Uncharacterized protein n=1 Tax=Ramlibacter monticola TaxID=1926872 RepID=A0A937CUR5_9BURK|nr:hypothetical protein [Ramlibacter monticola]MBL0393930.1 hypothetical protein [Ramlibacter monticola]
MAPVVSFAELLEAYEWVSAGIEMEAEAYVSRATGQIFLSTASGEFGAGEDALPENVGDESLYIPVPSKRDLDLGKPLVFRFVRERLPEAHARVESIFARRGAYGQFKSLLEGAGLLQSWYEFEARAVEATLREWAEEQELTLDDGGNDEG